MGNNNELFERVKEVCLLHGEFNLRSGKTSKLYFDKYAFEANPRLLQPIAAELLGLASGLEYDLLAGIEMGGIPIATAMSIASGKHAVFVRKKAKEYGTARLAEGADIKGKRLLIVEDVVSTGGQVIESASELRKLGAEIVAVVSVVCRDKKAIDNFNAEGLEYRYLYEFTL